MKYKEIRRNYQMNNFFNVDLMSSYDLLISPLFTKIFIKLNIIPNIVTCFMIISGLIGALFFAFPNIICKIIGIIFIHLWYILDCSDGEVARITRKFSLYGKELDYTAHIINHPLFILSFIINCYTENTIVFFLIVLCITDLIIRNYHAFIAIKNLKENSAVDHELIELGLIKKLSILINLSLTYFPMFVQLFPIILLFNKTIALYYLIIICICSVLLVIKHLLQWIKYIVFR